MAQETRAQLYAKILANLPDNTTEQITPATDRAVEDAEVESCFNLQDDDAKDVNYNPTSINADWLPEGDPSEVGEGLDILAARTGVNLSQDIAYVSNVTTAGITPELGNPLKPFASFGAAISAVGNNSIIKSLGGTFTENINLGTVNNFHLDLSGTVINGTLSALGQNGKITLYGGVINCGSGRVDLGSLTPSNLGPVYLEGGIINGTGTYAVGIGDGSGIINCIINNTGTYAIGTGPNESDSLGFVINCKITSTKGFQAAALRIVNCRVVCTNVIIEAIANDPCIVINSSLITTGNVYAIEGVGGNPIGLYMYNSYLKSAGITMSISRLGPAATKVFVQGCILIADLDCVYVAGGSTTSASGTDYVFKDCTMYAGLSNDIFLEPSTYNGSYLGSVRSINNTYNKTFTPNVAAKVLEYNKVEITGLQEPEIEV
jgi:hypothetical protein